MTLRSANRAILTIDGFRYSGSGTIVRQAVAFVAGVLGPLIGADLLNLRDIEKITTGIASIGGAGTFDGIVLSGIVAAYLA
jgi:uncharacterized membrane protein